jgi:hypothetical protein
LAPKLDNLWKHGGRREALVVILRVYKTRKIYMKKKLVHAKNERLYANGKKDTIVNQIFRGAIAKRKKKLV